MGTEKGWVSFPATLRKDNRVTIPPGVRKILGLKEGVMVNIKITRMESMEDSG